MRVPDRIKNCVVFFGLTSSANGIGLTKYKATGFFVSVQHPQFEDGSGFVYLVTAKHVARKLAGKEFVVRANTKDGKSIKLNSPADTKIEWYFHPTDDNADVAVFQWAPSTEADIEYAVVPTTSFLKIENLSPEGIGIGDEVCIVGLFTFHEGQSRNHPMLRVGNIAMIPDEKVTTDQGLMDAYLIEARSIGGISGSPVFVAVPDRKPRDQTIQTTWLLMGLIHGHWQLPASKINDMTENDAERKPYQYGNCHRDARAKDH